MKAPRPRIAPISGKLRIAILLTCAAALLCATAAMFAVQLHHFRGEYWKDLRDTAAAGADLATGALSTSNPETAQRILSMLRNNSHVVSARIVSKDGAIFAEAGEAKSTDRIEEPIESRGESLGVLQLDTDFSAQVMKLLGLHTLIFVIALAIAFVVAAPISSRLLHSILGPIQTLGETARRIAASDDYTLRAAKTSEDEVGAITDIFNSMLRQIQSRDQDLRREIAERVRAEQEMQQIHDQLMEASRQAGMAEVATGVLHNVGNVLNSVNVSATIVTEKLDPARVKKLVRAANLLRQQDAATLAEFLSNDPKGKVLPLYLAEVSAQLAAERAEAVAELASLRKNIDHIKDIVATQQDHARIPGIVEPSSLATLIEEALRLTHASFEQSGITIARDFHEVPPVMADRHLALQIFVNLLRNAKEAIEDAGPVERHIAILVRRQDPRYVQAIFTDNGSGIASENLTRIFSHGFTTREKGHGFGLHTASLAAQQMAGSLSAQSDGAGKGASFTLELPVANA